VKQVRPPAGRGKERKLRKSSPLKEKEKKTVQENTHCGKASNGGKESKTGVDLGQRKIDWNSFEKRVQVKERPASKEKKKVDTKKED